MLILEIYIAKKHKKDNIRSSDYYTFRFLHIICNCVLAYIYGLHLVLLKDLTMTKYYAAHYIRYDEIQDRAKLNHVEKNMSIRYLFYCMDVLICCFDSLIC